MQKPNQMQIGMNQNQAQSRPQNRSFGTMLFPALDIAIEGGGKHGLFKPA